MTNYESNSYHVTDEVNDTSAAFSTLPPGQADGDAVMKLWHTTTLPDGQPLNVAVCFTSDDVRGLQSYLNDQFGGRRFATGGKLPAEAVTLDYYPHEPPFRLPKVGEVIPVLANDGERLGNLTVTGENTGQFQPDVDLFHEQAAAFGAVTVTDSNGTRAIGNAEVAEQMVHGNMAARQCPVIYNGVQCTALADHDFQHQFPQTGDGAATPPATGAVAPAPAVESAVGADTPQAAPSPSAVVFEPGPGEKPKRKRRTKVEKAYDDALKAYSEDGSSEHAAALNEAHAALKAKDPGNIRISEVVGLPSGGEPGDAAAVPPGAPHGQAWIGPSFAAEAGASYLAQAQHPINQEFHDYAKGLPGEHVGDSVIMTPEQAATVPAFTPGQAPQLGAVEISPQEQQAASGFPCPVQSSDGRTCQRPYGHEIQTATNPEPKPHVYAMVPSQLGITSAQVVQAVEMSQPAFQAAGHPMPTAPLSFQVPPTPAEAPTHAPSGAEMQPPAPAAPFWQQPQG